MVLSAQKVIKVFSVLIFTFSCSLNFSTQVNEVVYEPVPEVKFPHSNPWSRAKEELAKKLIFDPNIIQGQFG